MLIMTYNEIGVAATEEACGDDSCGPNFCKMFFIRLNDGSLTTYRRLDHTLIKLPWVCCQKKSDLVYQSKLHSAAALFDNWPTFNLLLDAMGRKDCKPIVLNDSMKLLNGVPYVMIKSNTPHQILDEIYKTDIMKMITTIKNNQELHMTDYPEIFHGLKYGSKLVPHVFKDQRLARVRDDYVCG